MTDPGSSGPPDGKTITEYELQQCERANQTGRTPVVFVHGLWLLPNSWDRWAELFEQHGFAALTPGWPDDSETVQKAAEHPEVFAGKSVGQVADHLETIIRGLDRKPAITGHSTGGLLTQILAGRGLAAVSVAIDPAPFRGAADGIDRSIRITRSLLDHLVCWVQAAWLSQHESSPRSRRARDGRNRDALPPSDPPATAALDRDRRPRDPAGRAAGHGPARPADIVKVDAAHLSMISHPQR